METITPTSLVTSTLRLLGVIDENGPTATSTQITNGVAAANQMLDSWATQELTIPIQVREAFSISAYQQSLTIGSGGALNTVRPLSISAASIFFNPATVYSVTSITRSSSTATVTQGSHGYVTGQSIAIAGANQSAYNGTQTITKLTANTYSYAVSGSPATPATGTITAQDALSQAYELYMGQWTYAGYIANAIKGYTSLWPTRFYYEPTYAAGFGTIFIWPDPTQANTLVLYMPRPLSALDADALTTSITLPPGASRALRFNLAVELSSEYGVNLQTIPNVAQIAQQSLAVFKTQNDRPSVLSTGDAGLMFGWRWGADIPPNIYQGP